MKLIVGLGNPGTQYSKTRHNAGFMVVDALCAKHAKGVVPKSSFSGLCVEAKIGGQRCLLIKPTTFMNRSGQTVAEAVRFYKVQPMQDLLVIVDELYLATGTIRLKPGGGTAGHNGLASIEQLLGMGEYPRLRVGVGLQAAGATGRADGEAKSTGAGKPAHMQQADFVLGRFSDEEEPLLVHAIAKSVEAVEHFAAKGLTMAMNLVNAGPVREKPPKPDAASQRPSLPTSPTKPLDSHTS